ncbi:hypothetical protein [Salinicola tamaricis]|uniref:hypothetical protein n=1 Tax=Salinicola tamaricis TaxID=1771309 RepID=UPI00101AD4C0|nr:hypothetical protein [Salinicola tamaricis]
MAKATPPGGVLVALPGTLLPPTIFEGVALPDGWRWHGVDWLGGPGDGELTPPPPSSAATGHQATPRRRCWWATPPAASSRCSWPPPWARVWPGWY